MNFNFKEILEMFKGHWRFLVLFILVTATLIGFTVVPVAKSYFGSERQSCSKCLEENDKLLVRIMQISALIREYEYMKAKEQELNMRISEELIESEPEDVDIEQPNAYTRLAVGHSERLNKNKDSIIKRIDSLTSVR